MFHPRFRLAICSMLVFAGIAAGQRAVYEQSPRQALIEMLSGGEAPFKKHLTLEMQSKLQNMMKGSPDNAPSPLQLLAGANSPGSSKMQSFDIGPILFAFNNPQEHERYEVEIDSEEPRGEEDTMGLSLHLVRSGVEREIPVGLKLVVKLKRQTGVWRLNAVTMTATLPIGDPRILEKSWWEPALAAAAGASDETAATSAVVIDERPKMNPLRAVRMIGMAENLYVQMHPGAGYTCNLSNLVNIGKGMDEEGMYKFMDAEFAGGLYNGYRFTITGCERPPARMFRVIAEPVGGRGKAYCSDNTNNLRAADDGRGTTCLVAGKIARK
ncbi:MAG TPA: hypothetical protein VE604_04055 [Candidatus Polarisedimenticolia bacterium]|jgi:hypothetical protein|nr:hypothetical protein [Candidatus Polarisedimenticolia bacterium]